MRIGICTSVENIKLIEPLGFDYIEPTVTGIANLSDEEFIKTEMFVATSGIRCEVFNVLFPADLKLTGNEVDLVRITTYLEAAFSRICSLGAEVVVFGSGAARRIPDHWDYNRGYEQLVEVAKLVGDIATKKNLLIAMEPLNKGETNVLNSVTEGYEFVQRVGHPNVQLLADFYHMRMENESMDILPKVAAVLKHTHIANSNGRIYPIDAAEDDYVAFFSKLNAAGYQSRISIEAKTNDIIRDGSIALNLLRNLTC